MHIYTDPTGSQCCAATHFNTATCPHPRRPWHKPTSHTTCSLPKRSCMSRSAHCRSVVAATAAAPPRPAPAGEARRGLSPVHVVGRRTVFSFQVPFFVCFRSPYSISTSDIPDREAPGRLHTLHSAGTTRWQIHAARTCDSAPPLGRPAWREQARETRETERGGAGKTERRRKIRQSGGAGAIQFVSHARKHSNTSHERQPPCAPPPPPPRCRGRRGSGSRRSTRGRWPPLRRMTHRRGRGPSRFQVGNRNTCNAQVPHQSL